ncbi:MAG: hypothetical protein WEB58_14435 [Planctomycetaceae bacterium]
MGIGRREFLRLFGAGIAAATNPAAAIAIFDNQYINRRLGIAFEKPNGWVFADVKQMADVIAGQILDLDDVELSRAIVESVELPILTISKEEISADADRFMPGVTVYLERLTPDECADPDDVPPMARLERDVQSCKQILKDFTVTSDPAPASVSACDAAEYEATFVFEHQNLRPTPVRMKTLAIDQRIALYTLRMYDSPYLGGDMTFNYRPFIESVRMV